MSAVDVLAVLDAEIERCRIAVAAGRADADVMDEFEEARAAVAELIEAVRQAVQDSQDELDCNGLICVDIDQLRAALARCGDTP